MMQLTETKLRKNIWIVEDDADVAFVYQEILGAEYQLTFFTTLSEFITCFKKLKLGQVGPPELLLADLQFPDGHFFEILTQQDSLLPQSVPFLVVSSCDNIEVLKTCFDEGAIDYLTKPFTKSELKLKIDRFLKIKKEPMPVQIDHIVFDPSSLAVRKGSDVIAQLTARELQIFSMLHRARGDKVSRAQFQNEVWKNVSVTHKTLDVHLYNLRKKLAVLDLSIGFIQPDCYTLLGNGMDPDSALS